MKKLFLLAVACLLTSTSFAALSPFNQSIREIKQILDNDVFQNSFPTSEMIQRIEKTNDGYTIATSSYEMLVEVIYQQTSQIGPRPFELIFHKPVPLYES